MACMVIKQEVPKNISDEETGSILLPLQEVNSKNIEAARALYFFMISDYVQLSMKCKERRGSSSEAVRIRKIAG